jgi:uncharacterized protein (TIGR03790 family)
MPDIILSRRFRILAGLVVSCPFFALAGGSGLNVLVVVNPNSPNSLALGNYYCERRQVPPQNVLRLQNWTGGNLTWSRGEFNQALLGPLLEALSTRGLAQQIDFVLLSMDIPYEVTEAGSVNSTTSVLFYGFKPDSATAPTSCGASDFSSNSYAFSETRFRDSPPDTAPANAFLAMMLTSTDLDLTKLTVDQGVASDATFPVAPVLLATTSDGTRSVRSVLFADAIFDSRIQGNIELVSTNQNSPYGLSGLFGYQTGLAQFTVSPDTFLPGAMADSLTSFGGAILQPNSQTTLLAFLAAGATGSYGTVVEPCAYPQKFPSPRDYFYQARGFSLAECYYQSLLNPFQGLLVGEPLAAPFARPPIGAWNNLGPGALLNGATNLALQFTASDPSHPLQQVDLFLDGTFLETITNYTLTKSNLVWVSVKGETINYTVPEDATLQSVAVGLTDAINARSADIQISALAIGDRIEVHSMDPTKPGSQLSLSAGTSAGTGTLCTTFLSASRSDFVDSPAFAAAWLDVTNATLAPGDSLQLDVIKTNGARVALSATDFFGSPLLVAQSLANNVNSNAVLQQADGIAAQVTVSTNPSNACTLVLQARTPGFAPSQIQAVLSTPSTDSWQQVITTNLNSNLRDIEPRNHLYTNAGVTNLAVAFQLDTTALADGHHELSAVAYEGSHVCTQGRITQSIVISNTPLAATFVTLVGDTNSAAEGTLTFAVAANTNPMASIELFSTGGSLAVITNQATGTFSVSGTYLGVGLHPFYAVVTTASGAQYRTETKWIRLEAQEAPFPLAAAGTPPVLYWPAVAGRQYDIFSADVLTNGFLLRASVVPTNDFGQWMDAEPNRTTRFYRVRSSSQ